MWGVHLNHETKVHNTSPIRLCRRFFRARSFDFQARDVHSTLGAFRLWFDFQNRFDFGSRMQTGAPCPQHLPARRMLPRTGHSWGKCAFWVHISLNNDLANIRLTLHRTLNFESCQKAQKCIKKRRRGCRKR